MADFETGKNPENFPTACANQEKYFHVVQNVDWLREVIRLARENGYTHRGILKDAVMHCSDSYFSKWAAGDANLPAPDFAKLQKYALKQLRDCVESIARRHDREFKIDTCIELAAGLYSPLSRTYATHQSQMKRLNDQRIQSYYYVYKYSYRRHGEILKSAAVITHYKNDPQRPLIFIEKQINGDNQREDAAGVFFSKSYALWLMAQEVVEEQPRVMLFTLQETGFDDNATTRENHGTGGERMQYLCGLTLEAYARWKSHTGAPKGGFMSPIAMQRVPEKAFAAHLNIDEGDLYQEKNIDRALGEILKNCGYMEAYNFKRDETILQVVRDHMGSHHWADTSWDKSQSNPRVGGMFF